MSVDVARGPQRTTLRSHGWVYALLPLLLAGGCGLPTWSELIGSKKAEEQPLVVPAVPVQPTQRATGSGWRRSRRSRN